MIIDVNKIVFQNSKEVIFSFPVKKTLSIEGVIVVLLDPPPKMFFNENVYGFDSDGNFLWQIEQIEDKRQNCPFISMVYNDEKLMIRNWCHLNCEIDIKSGKIINMQGYGW